MTILLFIVILSVLIFVHEFGHFFAARRLGIRVEEFGFGFPPRLIGVKRGETTFSLNLIPFGGFVRLLGENGEATDDPTSFARAPWGRKIVVLAAGVLMNAVLAWLLWSTALISGVAIDPAAAPHDSFARVASTATRLYVTAGGAAEQAGLRSGLEVRDINGQTLTDTEAVIRYAKEHNYPPLSFRILDHGHLSTVVIRPQAQAGSDHPRYGLGLSAVGQLRYPWYVAPWYGLTATVRLTGQTLQGIGQLIGYLVTTGRVSENLAGPVGIAVLTGEVSRLGLTSIVQFVAILSISLAVINFLPLPALDGGRAAFILIQRVLRRTISPRFERSFHAAGFYLLILLLILISIRDVQRFDLLQKIRTLIPS